MIRPGVVFSLLFAAAATGARAQTYDPIPLSRVPVGSEIRVWTRTPPLHKWSLIYTGSTATSINVAEQRGSELLRSLGSTIPLAEVQRLEAYRGRKGSGVYFLTRTLAGAAIGAFLGGTIGAVLDEGLQNPASDDARGVFVVGAIGLATGTVGGAIAGANGQPVWGTVILPR
jgi:hypothetical protein